MTRINTLPLVASAAAFLVLGACGQQDAEPVAAEEPAADETLSEPMAMPRTASPEGARVFFISPADGGTVSNPIAIEFGIEEMSVVVAGVNETHSGHDHLHIPHDPPVMSESITILVE